MKNLLVRDSQGTDVRLLKAALLKLLGADGLGTLSGTLADGLLEIASRRFAP